MATTVLHLPSDESRRARNAARARHRNLALMAERPTPVATLTAWPVQNPTGPGHAAAGDILRSIGDALVATDLFCRITYLNAVAERLTGWTSPEAVGLAVDTVIRLVVESTRAPVADMARRCLAEGRAIDLEEGVVLVRRDGTDVPIGDSAAPIRSGAGQTTGVVLILRDESERRRVGHRLAHEATHDALTGRVNRREFDRRLQTILAGPQVGRVEHGMLFIDLDRFKAVNDSGGHAAGDALLRRVASTIAAQLRPGDTLARLGGDEFGALLRYYRAHEALGVAEAICRAVHALRFEWEGTAHHISASIGLLPVIEGRRADVLHSADAACYVAKERGGNAVHAIPRARLFALPARCAP